MKKIAEFLRISAESFNDIETFIKHVSKLRKTNKRKWFTWVGTVNGKSVQLKAIDTYLQVYTVNGIRYGGAMDISVKQFNEILKQPF